MKGKKLFALLLALMMIFTLVPGMAALGDEENEIVEAEAPLAMLAPTAAAVEQTIYLKGDGSEFTDKWNNVFYLGDAEDLDDPQMWHLVYTGDNMDAITAMQLDFGENGIWEWEPDMGFSTNNGGNNPGWVVAAPTDWVLVYVNQGNNNESDSFVVTEEGGNIQFNISGYHEGTPPPPPPVDPKGTIDIAKFVDGVEIMAYFDEYDEIGRYIVGFNIYKVDYEGQLITGLDPLNEEPKLINAYGRILFEGLEDGWYAIEEILTPEGEGVFDLAPVKYIEIADGEMVVTEADFDFDASYLVNYNLNRFVLGAEGLNAGGEIFFIEVENKSDASDLFGNSYNSFCAFSGAKSFANDYHGPASGYMKAIPLNGYRNVLDALNYIYNNYGSVDSWNGGSLGSVEDSTRLLSQVVIWNLYCGVEINKMLDNNLAVYPAFVEAIKDVLQNSAGSTGPITALAYLRCELDDSHDVTCQPQIIPLYGGNRFDNNTTIIIDPKGTAEFDKVILTADGYELAGMYQFKFMLYAVQEDGSEIPVLSSFVDEDGIYEDGYYYPNMYGRVLLGSDLVPGKYIVKEIESAGWKLVSDPQDLAFEIIDNGDNTTTTVWADGSEGDVGPEVVNTEFGSLTVSAKAFLKITTKFFKELYKRYREPYKTISEGYGSVTATNVDVKNNIVANSNHFTFAKLDPADLAEGVVLDMVVGNKVDKCGSAFVKMVDGQLVVTVDDVYKGSFGAVAFAGFLPTVKNGNIHSVGIFNHNASGDSVTVDIFNLGSFQSKNKKDPDYDKDWADLIKNVKTTDGFIYLYLHGDFTFDLTDKTDPGYNPDDGYIYPPYGEWEKVGQELVYTTPEIPVPYFLDINVVVTDDNDVVFEGTFKTPFFSATILPFLAPGEYTVAFSWEFDGIPDGYSEDVTVVAGEDKKVSVPTIDLERLFNVLLGRVNIYDRLIDNGDSITLPNVIKK